METACEFNTEAASLEELLNESDIQSTSNSLSILRDIDFKRLQNDAKQGFNEGKVTTQKTKSKEKGCCRDIKKLISGAFGLKKAPELDLHAELSIISQRIEIVEPAIKFINENNIFLVKQDTLKPKKWK